MQPTDNRTERNWDSPGRLVPAVILIAIGALFLLSNLRIIPNTNWFDFWPVILIVIGASKLADAPRTGGYTGGVVLVGIGGLFLVSNLGLLPNGWSVWDFWPVALIAVGIMLLLERVAWPDSLGRTWARRVNPADASETSGDVNLTAVFSGGKRRVSGEDFRGGVISAVFGGFELDLRQAFMTANSAVLKIDVVFGGAEIKIPTNWCAVVKGAGIFGGYSDETLHPQMTPETKRLIVKGGAVFGGVVVKN